MAIIIEEILGSIRDAIRGSYWVAADELRLVRNSIVFGVLLPLLFIVPGAFLGGWSWSLKVWFIGTGIMIAAFFLLWLAWRRALIGIGGGTLWAGRNGRLRDIGDETVFAGIGNYIRIIAGVVASEIAFGFIALALPAHVNPTLAILLLPACLGIGAYAAWQGGVTFLPSLVWAAIIMVVLVVVVLLLTQAFLPDSYKAVEEIKPVAKLDAAVRGVIEHGLDVDSAKEALGRLSLERPAGVSGGAFFFFGVFFLALLAVISISALNGRNVGPKMVTVIILIVAAVLVCTMSASGKAGFGGMTTVRRTDPSRPFDSREYHQMFYDLPAGWTIEYEFHVGNDAETPPFLLPKACRLYAGSPYGTKMVSEWRYGTKIEVPMDMELVLPVGYSASVKATHGQQMRLVCTS